MLMVEESPAILSGDVVQKPMLVDDTMRPSELVQEWLNSCVSHRDLCRKAFSGDLVNEETIYPGAPHRLIEVYEKSDGASQPSARLIERRPRVDTRPYMYVALSHCWGPPNERPLCTTRASLGQHMLQVPWGQLPQTFQDSILLCQELSIQYLWIDSLCIIQDDEENWSIQSRFMGQIYERALFTSAASSAKSSTEGLFRVRKSLDLVRIPYYDPKSGKADRVLAYIEPDLEKCISSSPLNQRARVMQEYFLSRRIVHFTTHGLVWSCKNGKGSETRYMMSEFGSSWEAVFEDDWRALVQSYTWRQLTYKSDKLVAIEGLSRQFSYRHKIDRSFQYRHSLWLENMPHDLMWYGEERLVRDMGNYIPSWSWASTAGPISFKASVFGSPEVFHAHVTGGNLTFILGMEALVRRIDDLEGPVRCQAFCFEDVQDMGSTGRMHEEYRDSSVHVAPTFVFRSGGKKVGWGVFDQHEEPSEDVFCLPLIKQKVWEGFASSKEQHFLWVLLVSPRPVMVAPKTFERVGWGLHFVPSWFDGLVARLISLV